jgi:Concanavalin A-like lectin/glucanases superfamily
VATVRGATIVVQGDLGVHPFILDRDYLDLNPGSELTPWTGAWDDVTCDVTSIQWAWGANDPLGPLTEAEGGRASFSLYDPTRDYDPSNTASPYIKFLRVGMPLRVLVDGAAGWTGTLEAWEWEASDQVATLLAIDAVATLAALVLPTDTVLPADTTAAQAAAVLDAVAWPAANRSFTGTSTAHRDTVTVSGQAMEALRAVRLAELGAVFSTRAGVIAWWARGASSATPAVLINCGGVGLVGLSSVFNRGRVRNVVRIDGGSSADYVASLSASATIHGPRTASATLAELAFPPDATITAQETAWAQTILDGLGNPRPASRLGTLVPVGAAQVDAILRAEWGDQWHVVDTGTSPPIDRYVVVLGERVSITPSTIEVDAVTEDVPAPPPPIPNYRAVVMATPGLVSYWRLGETSGTVAADEKGTNPGTYIGSPTLGIAGATGDGNKAIATAPGYVSVPDSASLDTGDVFSLEAWVQRDPAAVYQGIMGKGRNSYAMYLLPAGTLRLDKHIVSPILGSTVAVPTTGWHHVVFTKNGSSTAHFYLDGVDVSTAVTAGVIANTATRLYIGATNDDDTVSNLALQAIDEVAVYNVELTAAQVLDHYNAAPLSLLREALRAGAETRPETKPAE